jgi:hypothetical protein
VSIPPDGKKVRRHLATARRDAQLRECRLQLAAESAEHARAVAKERTAKG